MGLGDFGVRNAGESRIKTEGRDTLELGHGRVAPGELAPPSEPSGTLRKRSSITHARGSSRVFDLLFSEVLTDCS